MAWVTRQLAVFAVVAAAMGGAVVDSPQSTLAAPVTQVRPPPVLVHLSAQRRAAIEGSNPSLAQKVLGYDAWVRAHGGPPSVLVVGSSRAVQIDPQEIQQRTGATAYNAGITNAAVRDLLAMVSYADLRTPGRLPRLVVFLDVEMFGRRTPTERVLDYQRRILATRATCPEPAPCQESWLRSAESIANDARARQNGGRSYLATQRADGHQLGSRLAAWEAQGVDLRVIRNRRIAIRVRSYGPGQFDRLYPVQKEHFERLVALANARGVRPMVVLTPMHPACIRICGAAGWTARRRAVQAYLRGSAQRGGFTWRDYSYPATWGGTGASFYDEIHLRPSGASLVVGKLAALGAFGQ
jgi:hypothetical protein